MNTPLSSLRFSLFVCLSLLCVVGAGCGEDEADTEEQGTSTTPLCACEDGSCAEGQCVLQIVLGDACAESWGTAQVFVNNTGADDSPVGTVAVGKPFTTCDPFNAQTVDADGNVTQAAENFTFIVESEDTRLLSGSVSGETFQCAGSAPFVWTIDQGCD